MKHKFILIGLILAATKLPAGQEQGFAYRRRIEGITQSWHRLHLDPDIFGKVSADLRDLRILGIKDNGDTVEAPYILNILHEKTTSEQADFEPVNETSAGPYYFYSFRNSANAEVNEITLEFRDENFDWRCRLEGSYDQLQWYTILDDYRILSIRNDLSDYSFTKLAFPRASFGYLRLRIANAAEKPSLMGASFTRTTVSPGLFREYRQRSFSVSRDREAKQTRIDIDLGEAVPVSQLALQVRNNYDYYRPLTIEYLTDSVKTAKGWHYSYSRISEGVLSSFEKGSFTLPDLIARRLRVLVWDRDNQPLEIADLSVKGSVYELVARFNEKASYSLVYGNTKAKKPAYDLESFRDRIPADAPLLQTGPEESLAGSAAGTDGSFFSHRFWLWAVILLVIAVLGWFTLKMMQTQNNAPAEQNDAGL